jgi:hypothetical protein
VRLISISIARMYEELMEGSRIEVCTFRTAPPRRSGLVFR